MGGLGFPLLCQCEKAGYRVRSEQSFTPISKPKCRVLSPRVSSGANSLLFFDSADVPLVVQEANSSLLKNKNTVCRGCSVHE
jgi:hypothetical protein